MKTAKLILMFFVICPLVTAINVHAGRKPKHSSKHSTHRHSSHKQGLSGHGHKKRRSSSKSTTSSSKEMHVQEIHIEDGQGNLAAVLFGAGPGRLHIRIPHNDGFRYIAFEFDKGNPVLRKTSSPT